MKTQYAPAERQTVEKLKEEFAEISSIEYLPGLINALPYVAAVLNPERQIIYSNDVLLDTLKVESLEIILGKRPGEAINCTHSEETMGGCGTTESCRYCGAVNTILKSIQLSEKVSDECRIVSEINGNPVSFDFLVTAMPFIFKGKHYTILSLVDISNEKRRKALERIFFHDVINTAGSLRGVLGLLKEPDNKSSIKEYLELADEINEILIEEILLQRDLLSAENNELKVKRTNVFSDDLMKKAITQIMHNSVASEKIILVDKNSCNIAFSTDEVLLRRILVNMLKNALEATPPKGKVEIGCSYTESSVTFRTHNKLFMPPEVQLQVFMRSFSTKSPNRGLGTYSMKLIAEKYLNGKVYFKTSEKKGTTFYVEMAL